MLASFVSAFCWALLDILRKQLSKTLSPLFLTLLLSVFTIPLFIAKWSLTGFQLPSTGYFFPASISAILATIGSVSFIYALSKTKLAIVLPIVSTTPIISAFCSWLFVGELLTLVQLISLIVIVIASWVLIAADMSGFNKPALFACITAICWGSCIVFDKSALEFAVKEFHALYILGVIAMSSTLLLRRQITSYTVKPILPILLIATLCFFFAVYFQFAALEVLNPGVVEAIKRGVGVVSGVIVGYLIYKESLIVKQYLAIAAIFIAVVVM